MIVDYLQLVRGKPPKETDGAHSEAVAQWMANMARATGLWFITAAQLNQEDNVRGGEGLKLACDQYFVLHWEEDEAGAWLECPASRHTLRQNVGSKTMPALWVSKRGPHFTDQPPPLSEIRPLGDAA